MIPETEASREAIVLRLEALRNLLSLGFGLEVPQDEAAAMFAAGNGTRGGSVTTPRWRFSRSRTLSYQLVGAIDEYHALVVRWPRLPSGAATTRSAPPRSSTTSGPYR